MSETAAPPTQGRKPVQVVPWTDPIPCFCEVVRAARWFNDANSFDLYQIQRHPKHWHNWVVTRRTRVPLFAQEGR